VLHVVSSSCSVLATATATHDINTCPNRRLPNSPYPCAITPLSPNTPLFVINTTLLSDGAQLVLLSLSGLTSTAQPRIFLVSASQPAHVFWLSDLSTRFNIAVNYTFDLPPASQGWLKLLQHFLYASNRDSDAAMVQIKGFYVCDVNDYSAMLVRNMCVVCMCACVFIRVSLCMCVFIRAGKHIWHC